MHHIDDKARAEAFADVIGHAKVIQKGPGVEVAILYAERPDGFKTRYAFSIWNALRCSASVERR